MEEAASNWNSASTGIGKNNHSLILDLKGPLLICHCLNYKQQSRGFVSHTSVACVVYFFTFYLILKPLTRTLFVLVTGEDCVTNPRNVWYEAIAAATSLRVYFALTRSSFHLTPRVSWSRDCPLDFFLFWSIPDVHSTVFSISGAIYAQFPWEYYNDYYLAFKFARR